VLEKEIEEDHQWKEELANYVFSYSNYSSQSTITSSTQKGGDGSINIQLTGEKPAVTLGDKRFEAPDASGFQIKSVDELQIIYETTKTKLNENCDQLTVLLEEGQTGGHYRVAGLIETVLQQMFILRRAIPILMAFGSSAEYHGTENPRYLKQVYLDGLKMHQDKIKEENERLKREEEKKRVEEKDKFLRIALLCGAIAIGIAVLILVFKSFSL